MEKYVDILSSILYLDVEEIEPDLRIGDHCSDSFDLALLIEELERAFGIEIPEEIYEEGYVTVSELRHISKKRNTKPNRKNNKLKYNQRHQAW